MAEQFVMRGICFDAKSSYQTGPAEAPQLIRERLWSEAYNEYSESGMRISKDLIRDFGDFDVADYIETYELTKIHYDPDKILVTLGGDHSITYPVYKAVAEQAGPQTILHFDAHTDLYDNFEGDRYSHACPFARIMEEFPETQLIQIGIRTLTPHQRDQAKKFGVHIVEMKDFEYDQLPEITGPLYISLDIDVFDPAFAPGVSHQEAGGMTPRQCIKVIHGLKAKIIGFDLVEYNPKNDVSGITAALSAKLLKELMAQAMR